MYTVATLALVLVIFFGGDYYFLVSCVEAEADVGYVYIYSTTVLSLCPLSEDDSKPFGLSC
jgi:hypothetical protein